MADEETADEDSNPHRSDLKSKMTDQDEEKGTLSTEIEIKSELLGDDLVENPIGKVSPNPQVKGGGRMIYFDIVGKFCKNDPVRYCSITFSMFKIVSYFRLQNVSPIQFFPLFRRILLLSSNL